MKRVIALILISTSLCFAGLKYKSFNTLPEALDFISYMYQDSNNGIGGDVWWSTHRLIPIHSWGYDSGDYNKRIVMFTSYLVYWKTDNTNTKIVRRCISVTNPFSNHYFAVTNQ